MTPTTISQHTRITIDDDPKPTDELEICGGDFIDENGQRAQRPLFDRDGEPTAAALSGEDTEGEDGLDKDTGLPCRFEDVSTEEHVFEPHRLGTRGEQAAAAYLERRGFTILDRNWRCPAGEADIIALDGDEIVFVEVKTRSDLERGLPEDAITADKRNRYERIAAMWLQDHSYVDVYLRFDVVSILVLGSDRALLRYHKNAFSSWD